ncbi:MAG: O-antigen ligase family protein [Ilumatobacteraceae bacterium]
MSAVLAASGLVAGACPVLIAVRHNRTTQLACGVALLWLVYGAVIGSLPSPGDPGDVATWATTEGRGLVALFAIAVGSSFASLAVFSRVLRSAVFVIALTLVIGLVSHWFEFGVPLFDQRPRRLFHGLTSSHHVPGFLGASLVLVVVAAPGLVRRTARVAVGGVGLLAIGLSGSRSSLVGLAVGLVVVLAHLLDRRRFAMSVVAMSVATALLLLPVPRFRQTVEIVMRPEFVSEATAAFEDGTKDGARRLSESPVEANMLIRFALWGAQVDVIRSSPLIGIGRYRGNDKDLEMWGLDGLVYIAVDGDRSPVGQPHNMYLLLLGETGVLGLGLFSTPYVREIFRTRKRTTRTRAGDRFADIGGTTADASATTSVDLWAPVSATHRASESTPLPPGASEVRALARGALAIGLTIGFFSAALLTTGLGLVLNVILFGAAAAYADAVDSASTEAGTVPT